MMKYKLNKKEISSLILKFIGIILIFFISQQCSYGESALKKTLIKVREIRLAVPEPSGLALGKDSATLWTVSDRTNDIYQLDLNGEILRTIQYDGDDLEGIACDTKNDLLWIVEERKRQLIKLNYNGQPLNKYDIPFSAEESSGLEGVALDSLGNIWLVNEKKPARLIKLAQDFSIETIIDPGTTEDFSDICTDQEPGRFWILSDESRKFFLWHETQGVLDKYSLDISKPEGLAIDFTTGTVYIVSDDENKLYTLKFNQD